MLHPVSSTFDRTSAPFVRCGEIEVLSVATLVARNADEVVPMVDLEGPAFGGSLKLGGRFCVGTFCKYLVADDMMMCTRFNFVYKDIL
jgi:hypothetical protein